ncbi:hypothetical protein D3C76_1241340 [compost metagenome]
MADTRQGTTEMCIEVIHQRLRPRHFDIEYSQLTNPFRKHRMGHSRASTTGPHLYDPTPRCFDQTTAKAFGETQAVSVMSDALAVLEHHGIDCANAAGFRGQLIKQRQDRLFTREGDIQAGETHGLCGGE